MEFRCLCSTLRDWMNVSNPVQVTGDLIAAIVIALMVFAVGAGWLCDRWEHMDWPGLASTLFAASCFVC